MKVNFERNKHLDTDRLLEQCIVDLFQNSDDFHLIICGHLNARTGREHYIRDESKFCGNESDDHDNLTFKRNSDDRRNQYVW